MIERVKRAIRIAEAALTPRRSRLSYRGREIRCVRSIWWHDAHQASFDAEIIPYFANLTSYRKYRTICDAGAAAGLFSIAACLQFPAVRVYAFEPSARQQIVLKRNLRLNGFASRVEAVPLGLWKSAGDLEFRTHGAIGALRLARSLPPTLDFNEHVRVSSLDEWSARQGVTGIDLLKMDVEGAELEALEGSRHVLQRDRPELLIQAYHLRDGVRTFERCAAHLKAFGYTITETPACPGLLHAVPA